MKGPKAKEERRGKEERLEKRKLFSESITDNVLQNRLRTSGSICLPGQLLDSYWIPGQLLDSWTATGHVIFWGFGLLV